MYEKFGCRVTTVRPSYYAETKENALIMAVKLKEGLEVLHHE
jgi:ribosomal protein S18 acetylase RimI-like enzyme